MLLSTHEARDVVSKASPHNKATQIIHSLFERSSCSPLHLLDALGVPAWSLNAAYRELIQDNVKHGSLGSFEQFVRNLDGYGMKTLQEYKRGVRSVVTSRDCLMLFQTLANQQNIQGTEEFPIYQGMSPEEVIWALYYWAEQTNRLFDTSSKASVAWVPSLKLDRYDPKPISLDDAKTLITASTSTKILDWDPWPRGLIREAVRSFISDPETEYQYCGSSPDSRSDEDFHNLLTEVEKTSPQNYFVYLRNGRASDRSMDGHYAIVTDKKKKSVVVMASAESDDRCQLYDSRSAVYDARAHWTYASKQCALVRNENGLDPVAMDRLLQRCLVV